MKQLILFLIGVTFAMPFTGKAQCTTTNATTCICPPGGGTNCDLLPDITLSKDAISNGGYTEYPQVNAGTSQSSQGSDDGRLRLTGATPNIGYGPIEVRGISKWVCGTDTFTSYPGSGTCTDGSDPKQVVVQRVYHKNGNTMTYTNREAGTMTYHPSHGHQHVDSWGTYTLRIENPNDPNPLHWSIVGTGTKLAFCLLDLSNCNSSNNYCRDSLNNVLNSSNLPNYGLGGGSYGCSNALQGISAGYVDIYSKTLDGMWINIPPDVCNGTYWIVVEIDPNNNFQETKEWNNVAAVPVTLTRQNAPGTGVSNIYSNRPGTMIQGDIATLTATAGSAYLWSTGATTQSITTNTAGSYTVTVTSPCGTATSAPFVITVLNNPANPSVTGAARCGTGTVTLSASGTGSQKWYTAASGGTSINTGTSYATPTLSSSTTYYVESEVTTTGATVNSAPSSNAVSATGAYTSPTTTAAQYEVFTVYSRLTLQSVLVYANTAGNKTFKLLDKNTNTLRQVTASLPSGSSRVTLNWTIDPDENYRLQVDNGANLYYNTKTSNIGYPFSIPGVLSITNSSGGHTVFYFCYDWQIKSPDLVTRSNRVPVTATINTIPSVSFSGLGATYTASSSPVTLTGSPAGGTFSGPGMNGSIFNPATAGVGGPYTITYSYTAANGCTGTSSQQVTVTAGNNNCLRPFNLTTTNIANISAQVNWDISVTADTFRIRYSVSGTTTYLYKDVNGSGGVSSATLSSLSPGTLYQYQVSSICRGVSSGYSGSVTFTTLTTPVRCIKPYALTSSGIANTSATVGWTPYVAADTFRIRYSVNGTTNYLYKDRIGSAGNSASLTGLSPNITYQFQVSSICLGVSSGYSTAATFTTTSAPVPCVKPYGLGSSNVANTSATVSWTQYVSADTFRIRYSVNGTTNYLYKNVNGSLGNSTSLSNLVPNTTYQFQVSSMCLGLSSGYSAAATFTTTNAPVACATPYGLSTSNITNSGAVLNWTNMVTADSFMVRYSRNGTTNYVWKQFTGAGGVHSTQITGLLPNTAYQWQVRSICTGVSTSVYSASSVFTTGLIRIAGARPESEFELFPNPADEKVSIRFAASVKEDGTIMISDITGRVIRLVQISILNGENFFELNTADLSPGLYHFRVESTNERLDSKVVIQ
ncbi:MAG TPA: fibronectin type III domain-containing protein [Bacteroidia bacterium]|nr:fibronectin type III domain-containing protein [Bacteroidia bacterium]